MLGVALRLLRRRSLAEEAVHDTFLQVWQHASSFDAAKGNARTWLYAILRNRAPNTTARPRIWFSRVTRCPTSFLRAMIRARTA
ncbi:sigma factor [Microvirga arabica]|uniref:Sigma factor n=1 Tax=Microvirga arabica TaxID=1128671 RepID=A0ABV6YBM8_9HYPH